MTAPSPVRILLLEDVPADAELAQRELRKAGLDFVARQVSGREAFQAALAEFAPDLILSDHNVPQFTGRDALGVVRALAPHIPFILVTGSLDEETAVEYMKSGAADYVLKDRIVRLPSAVRGVLERKREREAKAQAERKYHEIFESAPVGILQSGADGTILTANPVLARMLGYATAEELVGLSLPHHVYWDAGERDRLVAIYGPAGGYVDVEVRWKKRDGTPIWVQLTGHVVRDETGRTVRYESFVRDVTERKDLEAQLFQAQKMEAIGRLAGGVAHDFNNILTAIIGYADLLEADLGGDHPSSGDVKEIRASGQRAATLTRQLLAFSRKQVLEPRVVNLNTLVADIEKMLRRLIGEDVELRTALAADLGSVYADPGQLEQVIVNLVVNARDAMPQGGKLTLETANVELDAEYASRHMAVTPGRYVMLAVSDTGTGMDEPTKARIFEPFFTTKEPGKGTGLGLSTVYGIVKQSGGNVWVYSELGQGTTFKIYLPRVGATGAPEVRHAAPARDVRGKETILLVEDAAPVRNLAQRVLEGYGYTVLEAGTLAEAEAISRDRAAPIALLLTDVVLPGGTGRDLADQVCKARPGVRVLYMSGYTDDTIVNHGVLEEGVAYLQKPFTPEALARKVRDVLDGAP